MPPRSSLYIDLTLGVNAPLASFQNVKLTSSFNWHIKVENWAPLHRATTNSVETWDKRGTIPGAAFKLFLSSGLLPPSRRKRSQETIPSITPYLMALGHKLSGLIMHVGFVQKPPNSVAPFLVNPRPSGQKVLLMIFSIGCMFVLSQLVLLGLFNPSCMPEDLS